jgi:high-affinity Fe2+/Pb2+ permease
MAKLAHMHLIIIAVAGLALWGVWRLIRAQIESGGDASQDESAPPQVMDADARKSDQS